MCGSLRRENIDHKIGHLITTSQGPIQWLGHCRSESPRPANSELVEVSADSYTEKGIPFDTNSKKILAYVITNKNFPQGKGLYIITREATTEELKRCSHPRHPLFK